MAAINNVIDLTEFIEISTIPFNLSDILPFSALHLTRHDFCTPWQRFLSIILSPVFPVEFLSQWIRGAITRDRESFVNVSEAGKSIPCYLIQANLAGDVHFVLLGRASQLFVTDKEVFHVATSVPFIAPPMLM